MYAWLRGQKSDIFIHIFEMFLRDEEAKVLITAEKFDESVLQDQVVCKSKITCGFSGSNNSMQFYFYVKTKDIAKEDKKIGIDKARGSSVDKQIRKAFKFFDNIHGRGRFLEAKEKRIKEEISTISKIIQSKCVLKKRIQRKEKYTN